mmetsp:Transcript_71639/g.221559  ORF Transcript_71639/g.221559 Transcript_71639/m.221559 type:complete len:243 (+) Transcript_71639:466-1194(+)
MVPCDIEACKPAADPGHFRTCGRKDCLVQALRAVDDALGLCEAWHHRARDLVCEASLSSRCRAHHEASAALWVPLLGNDCVGLRNCKAAARSPLPQHCHADAFDGPRRQLPGDGQHRLGLRHRRLPRQPALHGAGRKGPHAARQLQAAGALQHALGVCDQRILPRGILHQLVACCAADGPAGTTPRQHLVGLCSCAAAAPCHAGGNAGVATAVCETVGDVQASRGLVYCLGSCEGLRGRRRS